MLGACLGFLVKLWVRTLRVTLSGDGALLVTEPALAGAPALVLAFLHGQQMSLLAARRRRSASVIVSHSRDGDLQARVMAVLGFDVVRGSSSRGGARALAAVIRRLRLHDAVFAVDGPRGPAGVPKPGASLAARRAGALLLPVASAAARAIVLSRAWDAFEIPLPFTRVAIVVGAPVRPGDDAHGAAELGLSLAVARAEAERIVGRPARGVLEERSCPAESP